MAVPTTLVIDATQETLEITNSRDATALRGYSIETGPPTDGEGLFFQASSSEYVFRTVDESIDDRVAELIQDSAAGGLTWTYDDSAGTLTPAYVGDSTLVTTGAINSGSITSGFTSIDVGAGAISTTGTVSGGVLAGTLSTAAQGNVTSLCTLTALQVDNININLNTISSTAGTDLNITPLSGQQIVLDGAIIIDAGVVTGATSITSTAFAGDLTGDVTGNADTATALETARTIGGTSFDGTASIVPATITVADTTDTTAYVALFESATGDLAPKSDAGVTYNASSGVLTATGFAGPLTGNVTGNVTGSSGSTTGNAATATALETARTIGGVSFDGTGNIVPGTITVADTTDTTSYVALFESATGDLGPKTDAGITYNAGTGLLTATGFSGPLTGNVTGDCSGSSGSTTGNAATATLASTVTVADSSDTTAFPAFFDSATGSLAIMTDASNLTYNASTGVLTATGFAGPLTGNVTGDVSGSSGSTTGNAATATALQTARTIGGTSFDGTGNIVPATITVADTTDTTSYVAFFDSATGDLGPKTDAGATYNASTGVLTATGFAGPLTGNVTGNVSGSSGSTTGNAATATLASTVTVADSSDTTAFPAFFDSATGSLAIMTDASNLTYNASTGVLTATGFAGPLTGNVTGDVSGSSGSTTGNAATATALATARTIGGTSFDGTANIVPATITVADTTDTTSYVALFESATGDLGPKSDAGITYNAGTGTLASTAFSGPLTGNVTGNVSGSAASLSATLAVASGGTNITSYTAGDILYASGSTTLAKLAKGSDTEVLTLASGVPSWAAPSATTVAPAGTLTGDTLASNVLTTSLTSVGTLTSLGVGNITSTGNLVVSGTGPHSIGAATQDNVRFRSAGSYTSGGSSDFAAGHSIEGTITGAVGDTIALAGAIFQGSIVTQGTDTNISRVAQVMINTPSITNNLASSGKPDIASTLWLQGAPSAVGDANYALYVAAGLTAFGDNVLLASGKGFGPNGANEHLNLFATGAAGEVTFYTAGTSPTTAGSGGGSVAMTMDASADVNIPNGGLAIGTTTPSTSEQLRVEGATGSTILTYRNDASISAGNRLGYLTWGGDGGDDTVDAAVLRVEADGTWGSGDTPSRFVFKTTPDGSGTITDAMTIDSSQDVLIPNGGLAIGTTSAPSADLDLGGATNTYSGDAIILDGGNGGLFITDNTKYLGFWATHGGGSFDSSTMGTRSNHDLSLMTNDIKRMTVAAAGTVDVVGTFTAGTKTFKIDHPLPDKADGHHLVHSSIEGPKADLIYRGTVDLSGGYAQVDLDDAAGMTEGTFEALARDSQCWIQNDSGWSSVRGSVEGNTLTVECEETDSDDTVSWMVVAERCDPHIMEAESTDEDGHIIVEPEKPEPEEEE